MNAFKNNRSDNILTDTWICFISVRVGLLIISTIIIYLISPQYKTRCSIGYCSLLKVFNAERLLFFIFFYIGAGGSSQVYWFYSDSFYLDHKRNSNIYSRAPSYFSSTKEGMSVYIYTWLHIFVTQLWPVDWRAAVNGPFYQQ